LLVTYSLAKLIFTDFRYSLIAIFFLATNYTFSAYMTGGLETQLQCFLIISTAFMIFKALSREQPDKMHLLLAGVFTALAILTRLDSGLLCGILIVYFLFAAYGKQDYKIKTVVVYGLVIAGPILILVVPWLLWKYSYYGNLLPNPFYLKANGFSFSIFRSGIAYVGSFFASYYLFPFFLAILIHYKNIKADKFLLLLFISIVFWIIYIIKVGGDFMEYRFFVPILPFIMILVTWSVTLISTRWLKIVLSFMVVAGSFSHFILFNGFRGIESVKVLHDDVVSGQPNWALVGIRLGEIFQGKGINVTIATTTAGAVPYYSGLKTIDMLGLNDPWIARFGESTGQFYRPGHNKWGKLDYYLKVKANLIVGLPQIREKGRSPGTNCFSLKEFGNFHIAALKIQELPPGTQVIEIPLDDHYNFYVLYLVPLPGIDRWIREEKLKTFAISG
jgi:arabinofuranosyltransferase